MARVVALSCALLLVWIGYALACSPIPGDNWFDLSVTVNTKTLPKNFVVRAGSNETVGKRDCVLADGTRFESYALRKFEAFAKNYMIGDGRPAHIKLPKPESVKLEIYCDPLRHVTQGRFSYRRMDGMPDKWTNHMELDLAPVAHLVSAEAKRFGSSVGDLLLNRVEPAKAFCTMSAQRLFYDHPFRDRRAWGHGALSLASLAGADKHVGIDYRGRVTAAEAAKTRGFEVYVDCYGSMNVIEAKLRYALKKLYDPNQERRSAQACNSKH